MNESTETLTAQMGATREEYRDNFRSLGARAKSAGNLRQQFRRHPLGFLGLAIAGGALLGTLTYRPRAASAVMKAGPAIRRGIRRPNQGRGASRTSQLLAGVGRIFGIVAPLLVAKSSSHQSEPRRHTRASTPEACADSKGRRGTSKPTG